MLNTKQRKSWGMVALCLIVVLVITAFGTIIAFATTDTTLDIDSVNDAEQISVFDRSGFSIDSNKSTNANDASDVAGGSAVTDESIPYAAPITVIPAPQTTGQLQPGAIFTTTATYSIAKGQCVTYNGTWTPTTQSFDVGIYDTVAGNYIWFNCTDGSITNFSKIIDDSSAYKIAFRNPSANSYNANFNITFVID